MSTPNGIWRAINTDKLLVTEQDLVDSAKFYPIWLLKENAIQRTKAVEQKVHMIQAI